MGPRIGYDLIFRGRAFVFLCRDAFRSHVPSVDAAAKEVEGHSKKIKNPYRGDQQPMAKAKAAWWPLQDGLSSAA